MGVATLPKLGAVLTGPDGKTLYTLAKDSPGKSTCTGDCAKMWPPLRAPSGAQVTGAQGVTGTLSTISRPDGGVQVTFNGRPLYSFSGDTKPGDANGQGIGGVWFAAAASGSAPASSANPSGGGYGY